MEKTLTQVLLIEDNPADVLLLREALEQDPLASFQVTTAERLKAGVELLQENDFDVILLDLGLPDSQGLDTFIKLHKESPKTPVVILSGLMDEELAFRAIQFGAQDYLVKRQEAWNTAARTVRYAIERQQSQIALRESEGRFRLLFEHSPVAYQSLDSDGVYIDFNAQLCELLGYEPHELMGESFSELWSPETRSTFPRKLERFKRDGKMEADLQLVKKDGIVIEVLMQGKIQHDINGQALKAHCILHDITARKITEQAIHASQERFSAVFRSNPLGISITEPADGTIIDANESFLHMFGYTRAEMLRHTTLELNLWQDTKERGRTIKKLHRHGEVTNTELSFRRKTGETINALASYRLIELNGKQYVLNMLNDITDRKQTEKALNDSEKRFNALLENGLDNISLLSADGVLLWESPAAIRTLDYEPNEFVGRNIFELLHPDDQERIRNQYRELLQQPGSRQRDTFRLRHSDGSWRWVESVATNMLNEPSVNAVVVNYHDISEQKEMEHALQKSEMLFLQTFQFSPIALAIEDAATETIITANESYLQLTGYRAEEVIGNTIRGLKLYPDNDQLSHTPSTFYQSSGAYAVEFKLQTKSGEIRDVLDWNDPINLNGNEKINLRAIVDITERKQAEEKLRESEARFASIFHTNPTRVCITSFEDGRFLDVNETFLKSCGYTRAEVIGHTSLELNDWVDPQARIRLRSLIEEHGRIQNFETQIRRKSGGIITVLISAELIELFGQSCILSVGLDITERKQANDLLRDREQRLQAIIENEPECIKLLAPDGTLLQINPAGLAMFEADDVQSVLGKSVYPIVIPEHRQAFQDLTERVCRGESGKLEFEIVGLKGTRRWLETHAVSMRNQQGEAIGLLGITRDITERKRTEDALRESEERYRALFEDTPVAIWEEDFSQAKQYLDSLKQQGVTDFHAYFESHPEEVAICAALVKILNVNKSALQMYGKESRKDSFENLKQVFSAHTLWNFKKELINIAEGKINFNWDGSDQKFNGEPFEISLNWSAVSGYEADLSKVIVSITDITERKRAEKALSESEALYRQAIEVAGAVPYYESYYDNGERIKYEFIGEGIRNITGYGPEEFTAALWDSLVLDVHLVKDLAGYSLDEAIQRVRSGENPVWKCEHRIRHRNGEIRWVFEAAVELRDEHGVSHGSIGMYQDITERKQAETAIEKYTEDLTLINSLNDAVNRGEDLDQILKQLIDECRRIFHARDAGFYMLNPDRKHLILEQISMPDALRSAMEKLIGMSLSKIHIPILPGSHYYILDKEKDGSITNDPREIQSWVDEFLQSTSLPGFLRPAIQKLSQKLIKLLEFGSILSMPLYSEHASIGLLQLMGTREFTETDLQRLRNIRGQITAIILRKQAEKALQESEQRYRTLINQTPAVVYIDDSSTDPGRTQFISPYIQTMLGFAPDEWINGGEELWKDRLHPDDRDRVLDEFKRSIQSDEPLDLEYRVFARDERVVWVHDQATTLRDSAGKPHLVHGVMYDITESKQAEASLRESEQRFRSLFNTSPDAIVLIDPHDPDVPWRVLDCNEAACKMNGYTRAELVGQSVDMLNIAPGTEEERHTYLDSLRRKGVVHVESTHRHKDGHIFPIEISTSLITLVGRELVLGIDRDITERRRTESERQTLLEIMRGAISTDDLLQYLSFVHHSVANVIQAENFFVILHNKESGMFEEIYSVDQYDAPQPPSKLEKSISAYVFRSGKPLLLRQALFDELAARGEVELIGTNSPSWLGVPLITSKETIGVMVVQDYENADQYSEGDKDFLESIAGQVAQIIERKQAEEALQESEERFSSAFEYAPIGIALVALDGRWLKINGALSELVGYAEPELLQRTFQDITHPDDLETDLNYVNQMLAGEIRSYQMEKRYIHKDGQIVWVLLSVSLVLGKDNLPLYFIAQIQDVTQRKQTEDEISHQLSELEALYENGLAISRMLEPKQIADRMVQVLDQKLKWHHAAVRVYHPESGKLELLALSQPGLNDMQIKEQIERLNQFIINPEYGLSGWVIKLRTAVRIGNLKENPNYIETYPGINSGLYVPIRSGEEIIGSIAVESEQENAFTERDERLLVTMANQAAISFVNARLYLRLQYELSERSQTEEKIRKLNAELEQRVQERTLEIETTHQRLELATASSGIGVWELKSGSDTFYWDERMYEIYGTTPEKFNPTSANWLDFIHPEDRQAEVEKRELAITQAGSYESEYRVIRADGSLRYLNSYAVVLVDEKRNFKDMIGVNMDITTIKQAEETLRMANSELERALRMKDEFLANMSHELRTPLNAILGLSESLEEQIAGQLNEKQQKYVHTISESGHHLLTLINDILDLAKIEAGQITLDINKMDIHAICQSSLRMVRQLAQKKNQKVELAVDDQLDLIWADERRLKQMMVNLLSNAVKFTPEGGKIGLEVHGDESDNKVLITVWDSGIGIKDADLPRLFQPFVQLDSSLARESPGTGLGLALVAQMARLHGGSVGVTSQPGMGSRFTIILPWEPALATDTMSRMKITAKFRTVKPGNETNRRTILLVEDTEEVVMMIRDYLESAAYKVVTARNGMEGITQARQVRPDLILMDVQMPGIDGLEATQILRSEPEFKHTPIIALTALAMPNDRERCLAAGMDEYITKPVHLKTLIKIIGNFLSDEKEIKPQ